MNPQSPGTGGPQRPRNGAGRPQQPGVPQQPGPEYVYETPDEFQNASGAGWGNPAGGGVPNGAGPAGSPGGAKATGSGSASGGAWATRPGASPVPGMSPKDFERLCHSVDKAFSQFAKAVEKGAGEVAEALGSKPEDNLKAYEEMARKRQAKARKRQAKRERKAAEAQYRAAQAQAAAQAQTRPPANGGWGIPAASAPAPAYPGPTALAKGRFRSSGGLTASGVIMTAIGGACTFAFGTFMAVGIVTGLAAGPAGVVTAVLFGTLTAAGAALLAGGIDRLRTASQLKSLRRIFGDREACTFDDIADRALISRPKALARARKLIRRGLIPQGRIDDEATTLMVTDDAYRQYRALQQHQRQIAESQHAADAARAAEAAARQSRERDLSDRLTPEQRAFIVKGQDYLAQLRPLDEAIDDAAVSARIVAIEEVVARILARAEEEPSVIDGLDRLTTYYLPTTVKLLAAYESLEEQPVQGENISSSRREIEHTLGVLHGAFEKLLDDTYQDLSLDVSADISVLHAMLAQEGLTEGPFDVKP